MNKLTRQQVILLFAFLMLTVLIFMIGFASLSGNQGLSQVSSVLAGVLGLYLSLFQLILPIIEMSRRDKKPASETFVNALAELQTANTYLASNMYKEAIDKATNVIKVLPKKGEAYQIRARAYVGAGLTAKALDDYEKAIALEPGFPFNYSGRASLLASLGEYRDAIPDFQRALAISPELTGSIYQLAYCYYILGQFTIAVKYFRQVIETPKTSTDEKSMAEDHIIRAENMLRLEQESEA